MRILAAIQHRSLRGGVETYLASVLPRLAAKGHEVGVLFAEDARPGEQRVDEALDAPVFAMRDAGTTLRDVAGFRPDVVFAHGLDDISVERALVRAHPVAFFAHTFHGTCISGHKRHLYPQLAPCDRPLGFSCLASYFPRGCGGRSPVTAIRLFRLQRSRLKAVAAARRVVVASGFLRDEYVRNGVDPAKVTVAPLFPTGLEPTTQPPRRRAVGGRILFLGRLDGFKGCDLLLDAVAHYRHQTGRADVQLTVAGAGPLLPSLQARAKRLGLSARFLGAVRLGERAALFEDADVIAIPSAGPEPFGLVGIEAGCFGVPAVAFDAGGIREWLDPGVNGVVAAGPRPTAAALADALRAVLDDPERHERLRLGAWERARAFSAEAHLATLGRTLEEAAR